MAHKLLLSFFVLFIVCLNAEAYDFEDNGIYYRISNEYHRTVAVTYKDCTWDSNQKTHIYENDYKGDVRIPSAVIYDSIQYSVTSIDYYAFSGCDSLTGITIPSSVVGINSRAFDGCTALKSLILPDSIEYYKDKNTGIKLFCNRGSATLLALWNENIVPLDISSQKELTPPYISVSKTTQTTITVTLSNRYNEYDYYYNDYYISWGYYQSKSRKLEPNNNSYTVNNIKPVDDWTTRKTYIYVRSKDNDNGIGASASIATNFNTQPLFPSIKVTNKTASSAHIECDYVKGDAKVKTQTLFITANGNKQSFDNTSSAAITGCDPNSTIKVTYRLDFNDEVSIYVDRTLYTEALTLKTLPPKVVSAGNVIIQATANLDEEESNVGFEWRRTDWTNDFPSNTGSAYIYDGKMEGYIRNLYTEKLWKYRPYYESDSGNRYYGDWVGIDPTNTSYFEPTVHTYANANVSDNNARVRGYAQRGTDNVVSRGFVYWKSGAASSPSVVSATQIPENAVTVEATGTIMEATLSGLDFNSTYSYTAFVKTSENETFYGNEQTISITEDPEGVFSTTTETKKTTNPIGIYDLNGRKLAEPQRGINVIRYKDGTAKKMVVK